MSDAGDPMDEGDEDVLIINEDSTEATEAAGTSVAMVRPADAGRTQGTQLRSLLLAKPAPVAANSTGESVLVTPAASVPERKSQRKIATRSKTDPEAAAKRRASMGTLIKAIYDGSKPEEAEDEDVSLLTGERRRPKQRRESLGSDDESALERKRRRKRLTEYDGEDHDNHCWMCHRDGDVVMCDFCPRVYHLRCLSLATAPQGTWRCSECEASAPKEVVTEIGPLTPEQFSLLLRYALQRMEYPGYEPFLLPVDDDDVPTYKNFVKYPMDLTTLRKNVDDRLYSCPGAFLADSKWILHNCVIFNGGSHKLTNVAKMIVKICKHEMSEIEICAECYLNSCVKETDNWFCEPCSTPHPLVWARLKGYPFWPAKALREENGQVDVRFFGEHDRAWIPSQAVYALSEQPPIPVKYKKGGFEYSLEELEYHVRRTEEVFGVFLYAPPRTVYDHSRPFNHVEGSTKEGGERFRLLLDKELQRSSLSEHSESLAASSSQLFTKERKDSDASSTASGVKVTAGVTEGTRVTKTASMIKEQLAARRRQREDEKAGVFTMSEDVMTSAAMTSPGGALERPTPAVGTPKAMATNTSLIESLEHKIRRMNSDEETAPAQDGDAHAQEDSGAPAQDPEQGADGKRNMALENLVKSCKAKLGIDGEPIGDSSSDEVEVSEEESDDDTADVTKSKVKQSRASASKSPTVISTSEPVMVSALTPPREDAATGDVIAKYSTRITSALKGVLEDMYDEVSSRRQYTIAKKSSQSEVDNLNWLHEQHIREIRHNYELTLTEMRLSFDREKKRFEEDLRAQMKAEVTKTISETKKKQWCTNCGDEAIYYCCWNTSYCGFQCQNAHWPTHMNSCSQNEGENASKQAAGAVQDPAQFVRIAPRNGNAQPRIQTSPRAILPAHIAGGVSAARAGRTVVSAKTGGQFHPRV